jgi:ribonuclease D
MLILHDAIQDLQILSRHTGAMPCNIFDTRRAAGFAGLPSTLSLANVLKHLFEMDLTKSETRSNWLQRPLTDEQIEYALDDVRHMIPCCHRLIEAADARGNHDALTEEMSTYDDPSRYGDTPVESLYLRFKTNRWSHRQRAMLYCLIAWREEEARSRNRPRGHIMQNKELTLLATCAPQDASALETIHGLSRHTLKRHHDAILEASLAARDMTPQSLPDTSDVDRRIDAATKKQIQNARTQIDQAAIKRGIDPALVGTKADITSLVLFETGQTDKPPPPLLSTGWRALLIEESKRSQSPQQLPPHD